MALACQSVHQNQMRKKELFLWNANAFISLLGILHSVISCEITWSRWQRKQCSKVVCPHTGSTSCTFYQATVQSSETTADGNPFKTWLVPKRGQATHTTQCNKVAFSEAPVYGSSSAASLRRTSTFCPLECPVVTQTQSTESSHPLHCWATNSHTVGRTAEPKKQNAQCIHWSNAYSRWTKSFMCRDG